MANITIGGRLVSNARIANIDPIYGPYDNDKAALDALGNRVTNANCIGLTVGIKQLDGTIKEFWLQPAGENTPLRLVEKNTDLTKAQELTTTQKHELAANINDRAADVVAETGVVKALGYKVLDKRKSFAEQVEGVNNANIIFEIKDSFNLNGGTATIPTNCTLKFNGGKITNGKLVGQNTRFDGDVKLGLDVTFDGVFNIPKANPIWFGAKTQTAPASLSEYNALEDQSPYFNKAVELIPCSKAELTIPEGYFIIKAPITWIGNSIRINGESKNTSILAFGKPSDENQTSPIVFDFPKGTACNGYIRNFGTNSLTYLYTPGYVFSKGIIFNNLYFRGGVIDNINTYRAGIFIKGFLTNVTKVSNCSVQGLGYAFLSAYSEDEYNYTLLTAQPSDWDTKFNTYYKIENGTYVRLTTFEDWAENTFYKVTDGKTDILVDSEISSCYINATNAFEASQTYSRCVFAGGVSTSVISNNYIDFFKYIFLGCSDTVSMGSHYFSNRITNNIFDYIFTFCKYTLALFRTVISQNTFTNCSWERAKNTSWGTYSADEEVRNKIWIVFKNCWPAQAKIEGNIYTNDIKVILSLSYMVNGYGFIFRDSDMSRCIQIGRINSYNQSDTEDLDFIIGSVIISNNKNGYRKTTYSNIPFKGYSKVVYEDGGNYGIYKTDSNYYDYRLFNYEYGLYRNFDLKPFMAEFGCYDKNAYSLQNKAFTINGVEEIIPVTLVNDKVVGCFSKDFKKLYDLGVLYVGDYTSNKYVQIYDLGISVFFASTSSNGELRLTPYGATIVTGKQFICTSDPTSGNFIGRTIYNSEQDKFKTYGYDGWEEWQGVIPLKKKGTTAEIPNIAFHSYFFTQGMSYQDTTLGKTVTWDGSNWVEEDGEVAGIKRAGANTQRPTPTNVGFKYFDTTLSKPIYWNGTAWVDGNGETIGLQVSDTSVLIGAAADSSVTINVYHANALTVSALNPDNTPATWLTVPSNIAVGTNTLTISAAANTASNPRGAKVIISDGTDVIIVNIIQNYSTT